MGILAYYEDGGSPEFGKDDSDGNGDKGLTISPPELYESIIF